MRESQYTAAVKKKLRPEVYSLKINLRYGAGVADNYYSGPVRDLWVEYKFLADLPPLIQPTELLSKLQAQWLAEQHARSKHVAVIIGSPHGGVILENVTWVTPFTREKFLEKMRTKTDIAEWISNFTSTIDDPLARPHSATPHTTH